MPSDEELQVLLDKQAIEEVCGGRYARALDWLDVEALKHCFWPDALVDYGFFEGNAHEWCDIVMPIEASSDHRFHYMCNFVIDVRGDEAEAECNGLAGSRRTRDGATTQSLHGSRYLDRLQRRDGAWRISERHVLLEMTQSFEAPSGPGGALSGLELVTGLGPHHDLYRILHGPE